MKKTLLLLLLFVCGCDTDWYSKGLEAETAREESKAFTYYQKGARKGDASCMARVAKFYEYGLGGADLDPEKAFQWYSKAAQKNNVEACYELGNFYLEGIHKEKDYRKAFEYFQKAVELGYLFAKSSLAAMYAKGLYVEQNTQMAKKLFMELVESSENATYTRKSLSRYLYDIGADFLSEEDVTRDEEMAYYWISMSVEWGNSEARNLLGHMHAYGLGTEKDVEKAKLLFEQYMETLPETRKYIGRYSLGLFSLQAYAPPEYQKALEYLIRVAEDTNADPETAGKAMYQISVLYLSDAGIDYDALKGKQWFDKAVEKFEALIESGSPRYMHELARFYEADFEATKNIDKAVYWYQQAANAGWEEAIQRLDELTKE